MRRALVLLSVFGSVTFAASAPPATLPAEVRQAAERITAAGLSRDLDFLASDELKGRNTPSPGFDKAAEFIADRLKKAGLKPLGDEGSFFQRYTMRESHVDTAAAYIEIDSKRLKLGDGFTMRSFAAPVAEARGLVYVGHGFSVPNKNIDPFAGIDLKGKIVVAHGPRALPKGVDIPLIGRINVGGSPPIVEAARRGAVAVIYIPLSSAKGGLGGGQSTVTRELVPNVPSAYAAPPLTSVMLTPAATTALFAGEHVDGQQMIALGDAADYPPTFELSKKGTLSVPESSITDHRPYNVLALLEGSDPQLKDEYITIEAHLDGAVGSRAVNGDDIYNAADDNASGSAGTLAIAEALAAGPRPKRSLIFIWDSGEERGLWGTRYFVHQPPVPLDKIVAHFNVDMIGANRAPGTAAADAFGATEPDEVYVIGPKALSAHAEALLASVNRSYLNMRFNHDHDRATSEFFYPRTDAGPFLERGILTIGFTTGIHDRYHLPADEAKYLDPKKMEAISRTVLVSAWALADSPERPKIDRPLPVSVPNYR
jgi:hypothetical protein